MKVPSIVDTERMTVSYYVCTCYYKMCYMCMCCGICVMHSLLSYNTMVASTAICLMHNYALHVSYLVSAPLAGPTGP